MENGSRQDADILKGLAAGIAAGFAASVVMNQFQKFWSIFVTGEQRSHGAQSLQKGSPEHGAGAMLKRRGKEDEQDDAAERLANAVAVGVFDYDLTEQEKAIAGTALHYAYGISMGAVYGAAAEVSEKVTIGAGMPYGFLIWIGADEAVVPLLGLSETPEEYPISVHAGAFSAHLVYGLTTEIVRKAVRKIL